MSKSNCLVQTYTISLEIVLQDSTLDEVRYSKYQEQFQIEMLLQNVMGFGDNAEFISKFGLRITDEIVFRVSTRRWDEEGSRA